MNTFIVRLVGVNGVNLFRSWRKQGLKFKDEMKVYTDWVKPDLGLRLI